MTSCEETILNWKSSVPPTGEPSELAAFCAHVCSFFRCKGVPSRLRCGFAAYLGSNWEDHWVCEYWDRQGQTWRLSDPQIDELQKNKFQISFDTTDIPRRWFVTAGQAWLECSEKRSNPAQFGHGDYKGLWFVQVNVVHDHYALNDRETSPWDGWRAAVKSDQAISARDLTLLSSLAADPEQRFREMMPDWLA